MEHLSYTEMKRISKNINSQEGRNYPCSNQIVICGFFSSEERWEDFCNENKEKILNKRKDDVIFNNGEHWKFFKMGNFLNRGYRFYKIKVDCGINREVFLQNIYPYCSIYCREIEWL